MQISAVMMARVLAFVEVQDLNPQGKVFYPDFAAALVQQFNFQVYPTKPEDFNEQTGVQFANGKFAGGTIDRVQIFNHGIVLDTRVSTDVSEELLHETLDYARKELGLRYERGMIKRTAYVSQLTFESNLKLNKLNPVLAKISSTLTSKLTSTVGQALNFETTGIVWNLDQTTTKLIPGAFTIERRSEIPFSENKFFSNAPLRTKEHIALLEELEKALS